MLSLVSALLMMCGEQDGDRSSNCGNSEADAASSGSRDTFEGKVHDIMDKMMHSKMMEELKALPSEVMEELKALPGELRESLLLHVERRSLVVAGVVVAVGAALMLLGCLWIHWCHTEHGRYLYIPVSQVEEFEKYNQVDHAHAHRHRRHSGRLRHRHKEGSEGKVITHRKAHSHIANGGQ